MLILKKKEKQKNEPLYFKNSNFNSFTEEDILNAYYDVFRNLGLKDDNIKFLTEEGLSDSEVIEYIEKITSKSLLELSRETIKYRSNMSFY